MGGSSTTQETRQTDNRRVIGDSGISAENSTVTVNTLDAEVVNRVMDSNDRTVGEAFGFGKQAFNFSLNSQAQALDSLNTTATLVKNAYEDAKGRGALTDQILIGSVVMAGLVAMAALKK